MRVSSSKTPQKLQNHFFRLLWLGVIQLPVPFPVFSNEGFQLLRLEFQVCRGQLREVVLPASQQGQRARYS